MSLAEAMGARAVGIVLSGYDGDGTEGCKHIKAKGGTTFAQDMSAQVGDMPLSAQAFKHDAWIAAPPEPRQEDRMRESRTSGSARGARSNPRPYRD